MVELEYQEIDGILEGADSMNPIQSENAVEAKINRIFHVRPMPSLFEENQPFVFTKMTFANGVFIFTIAGSTIPYYLTAGVDYQSDSQFISELVPRCTVTLNVVEGAYAAHEVWRYAQHILHEDTPARQRFLKVMASLLASMYSSFPAIAGANTLGSSPQQKVFLMTTISLSNLVYNLFSSYRFIDGGLIPFSHHAQYVLLQKKYQWYSCMQLKDCLKKYLNQAVDALKNNPQEARSVFRRINEIENGYGKLASLAQRGVVPQKHPSAWGRFFSGCVASAGGIAVASSWSGYGCSVETMLRDHMDESWAWILSGTIMAPLTYLAFTVGSKGIASVLTLLQQKWNAEELDWPLSLKYYPKTTVSLSLLMIFVATFGWADSVVLLRKTCPDLIQDIIGDSRYFNAAAFNSLLMIEFIDQLIKKYIQKWGSDDEKIALYVIQVVESLLTTIDNIPNPQFAKAMMSPRAAPMRLFFSRSDECRESYQQLMMQTNGMSNGYNYA